MDVTADRVVAVVGLGAVLPDARNVAEFWSNVKQGRYSIGDVPPDRWDPALYYDPDPKAPDKSYSRIGGWVRAADWDPVKWRLPIPPRVSDAMDWTQKWAIGCTLEALRDFGYPNRALDVERTAIILGNAMGGERHYQTSLRATFPEYARELETVPSFAALPAAVREAIRRDWHARLQQKLPSITEDTMPGELSNCIAGRLANLLNFRGPNFVTDAACASAMAAMSAAVEGLLEKRYDAVITGGIDRNMGASTFIKFCKIGALSATGTRPYADGADGFVMGEGAALFLMKRLADAERDGDRIYAVLRGVGGSSDGKGKGITAPNPVGQQLAISRAWENAGLSPCGVGLVEGHGTSTAVGDLAEVTSLIEVFGKAGCKPQSVGLGSVKSNIGHLKSAAGAAGVLKAVLALHEKVMPPSVNFHKPNAGIDFPRSPFQVITELRAWERANGTPRQAGVSAFGFGGTNFHVVLEEYEPGRFASKGRSQAGYEPPAGGGSTSRDGSAPAPGTTGLAGGKPPLRGALLIGASSERELVERLRGVAARAQSGEAPAPRPPAAHDLHASERIAIDYGSAAELADKAGRALKAFEAGTPALWKALRAQGVFRGRGPRGKVAFLYTGQGSQYLNMLRTLCQTESIVADTFAEADGYTVPLLGRPISEFLFVNEHDKAAMARAEDELRQTAITQPAVLTVDIALTRLLAAYGIAPDMVMGHSLGEYGALVACGAMPFRDALEAVSARGREMTRVSVADNGWMVAVFAPLAEIERIIGTVPGNVVIANINSNSQAVIGGASAPVEQAMKLLQQAGYNAMRLPVSHAFHTSIVAPASDPMRRQLQRLHLEPPHIPIVSNVTGDFYPMGPGVVPDMIDLLGRQVASPVQFIKGLQTLFAAGARLFVETGPKKALQGFAEEAFADKADVLSVFTNHPKYDDRTAFNQALCGAYALGHGVTDATEDRAASPAIAVRPAVASHDTTRPVAVAPASAQAPATSPSGGTPMTAPQTPALSPDQYIEIGKVFASAVERGLNVLLSGDAAPRRTEPAVVVTGASLGLPGTPRVFDDANVGRILKGDVLINAIPNTLRQAMAEKRITRLVKSDTGIPRFEVIDNASEVVKLAGRAGELDLAGEFGVPADRLPALDPVTRLSIGAGLDALRDAGIPLVQHFKTTTKGTRLPDRWGLPDALRDETGVIFTSAFPGMDSYTEILTGYFQDRARRDQLQLLEELKALMNGSSPAAREAMETRIHRIVSELERDPYVFDRRFLLRVLAMGHSQFAELIGARGPNTQINSACSSSTMAFGLAEDWIKRGRCKRVVVIGADNITSDNLIEWFGAGFLASGAAATDERVEDAALPFDKRRHGLIVGMGAAGVVIESADSVRARGLQPICEVVQTVTANSAFHGTRLDVDHIIGVMEGMVKAAEASTGLSRHQIAEHLVFVSHETYTPARGGSASAEVMALRKVFGPSVDKIVVANTKGYTGHPMAVGIEDVVAVKTLETGLVPPVANYREVDPELGPLNLSKGGSYPIEWAMRLGAGFGSQISMSLMRWTPMPTRVRQRPDALGYSYRIVDRAAWNAWLERVAGMPAPQLEVSRRTLRVKSAPGSVQPAAAAVNPQDARPVAVATQPALPSGRPDERFVAAPAATGRPDGRLVQAPAAPARRPEVVDAVREKIVALVVEKTGYPAEMLDLELDLEADLGIDTVKQAELLATIRGVYNIPRDENLKLRDFPTLAHVIRFVYDRRPDLKAEIRPDVRTSGGPDVNVAPTSGRPDERLVEAAAATGRPDERFIEAPSATGRTDVVDPVREKIVALVVEKTGYPAEMLDLELDLEADLGIDTVKQAELLATIRAVYDIPRDENLKLRDFPTLAHVIRFVYDRRPDLRAEVRPEVRTSGGPDVNVQAPSATGRPDVVDPVREKIVALVVEKTGYPAEMLDPELDLEADLGIDTVKQAELLATIRGVYDIPRDENLKLRDFPTLGHVIQFVYDRRPDLRAEVLPEVRTSGGPDVNVAPTSGRPDERLVEAPAATGRPDERFIEAPSAPGRPDVVDAVREKIVALVVEKTGYPAEMLDPELDLEADLGIDTVKQAELLATIRGLYDIPRDENLKLRDFPTLGHVIQFVYDRRPDLKAEVRPEVPTSGGPDVNVEASAAAERPDERLVEVPGATGRPDERPARPEPMSFDAANRIPRRVPKPVMRPPLDFCKATGVTFERGRRVIVMADQAGVGETLATHLGAGGVVPLVVGRPLPDAAFDALLDEWLAAGPVAGIYWLPALDREQAIGDTTFEAWREATRIRVKLLYRAMRRLYQQMDHENAFLVAATRCGGQHGYGEDGSLSALAGGVTGFVKAFKRERPKATVKAVDFGYENADDMASILIDETLRDPGVVEVGYRNGARWTIALATESAADGLPGLTLSKDSVFVVTGAAGSIVSAIVSDLATASGGVFYLFDRVPEPDPANPELKQFAEDRDGLKRTVAARLKGRGERVTPVMVEREVAAIERSYAALQAMRAVEACGGLAIYTSVDLTDPAAIDAAIETVREQNGHIDVLVHAAGIEISRFLPDKEPAEFERVFDVKANGWFNLLKAIGDMPLESAVVFSSIAGRFGNGGQTDYSSANDLLCKSVLNFRRVRPETRGIAIDWTAWSGIGMASRGSIPKMMELAGIDMLPPEAGVPIVRRELTEGGMRGEVVIANRLGIMLDEFDPEGIAIDSVAVQQRLREAGPMIGRIEKMTGSQGLVVETTLDPRAQAFLFDHQIDDTPVLPGVMGVEAFAELARLVLPGYHVIAVEDVHFQSAFKFFRHQPRPMRLQAVLTPHGDEVVARCRLTGTRQVPTQSEPQETVHFSGCVRLAATPAEAEAVTPPALVSDRTVAALDIYRVYFHGPAYRVLDSAWRDGDRVIGRLNDALPDNHAPADKPTPMAPRLIELCLQTAGLWDLGLKGTMALPHGIESVTVFGTPPAGAHLFAVVHPDDARGSFDADVIDADGQVFVRVRGYRTVAVPGGFDTTALGPLKMAMGGGVDEAPVSGSATAETK